MTFITRLTRGGRLTMPAEVRRRLGVGPGDRILRTTDANGNTIVRSMRYTIAELDGIVPAIDHPSAETDFDDMIAEAQEELIEAHLREIGRE